MNRLNKRTPAPSHGASQAYHGYTLRWNAILGECYISKGGSFITSTPSVDEAKRVIDAWLVEPKVF